jgi:Raf kinase inhibitor-like YbhB/YbcL family protein
MFREVSGSDMIHSMSSYRAAMVRQAFPICLMVVFVIGMTAWTDVQGQSEPEALKVISPVFENNGNLPLRYTCDGKNINPPLMIENVPASGRSLALILDDLDAPRRSFVHWIVWNIDPATKDLKESATPGGAVVGKNDFGKRNYRGPCPPTRAHRYALKLYVLDVRLNLPGSSKKADLEKAMKGHILGDARLLVSYGRKQAP